MEGLVEQKRAELVELEKQLMLERAKCALDATCNAFKENAVFYSSLVELFSTKVKGVGIVSVKEHEGRMSDTQNTRGVLFHIAFLHTSLQFRCLFTHNLAIGFKPMLVLLDLYEAKQPIYVNGHNEDALREIIRMEKPWHQRCFFNALEAFLSEYVTTANNTGIISIDVFKAIYSELR
jgi:hypothetical protein